MAPEQALGHAATASDWYSVGTILYQRSRASYRLPARALAILLEKQRSVPTPLTEVAAGLPEDLASLCTALLARDPAERPSGPEIVRRLGGPACGASDRAPAPLARGRAGRQSPLIGRRAHLEALDEASAAARQGATVLRFLRGPSGIGKSAIVAEFLERVRTRPDVVVLAGRCYEQESVPYKVFDTVIDRLSKYVQRLPVAAARALLPRDIFLLGAGVSGAPRVRGRAGGSAACIRESRPARAERRAFAVLREFLGRPGDHRPLVLAIDDLQWGDLDSALLLEELLRPPDPPALLFLGCYRSEGTELSPFLRALREWQGQLGASNDWRELAVETLPPSEARELAETLIALADRGVDDRAADVAESGARSPLFIGELVENLRADGAGAGERATAPHEVISLDEVLWSRILRLPAAARCLLEVVAVSGRPVPLRVACRAARSGPEERAAAAVLRGRAARSAAPRAESGVSDVEAYHDPSARDGHRSFPTLMALRTHHHRLAETLAASDRADAETLAIHYQGAGASAVAGTFFAKAGDQAAQALAFDRAAKLYRLALEYPSAEVEETDPERSLRARLGDALANGWPGGPRPRVSTWPRGHGRGGVPGPRVRAPRRDAAPHQRPHRRGADASSPGPDRGRDAAPRHAAARVGFAVDRARVARHSWDRVHAARSGPDHARGAQSDRCLLVRRRGAEHHRLDPGSRLSDAGSS